MLPMHVDDVGEFGLIETLAQTVGEQNVASLDALQALGFRLRLSIGDDAAAWDGQCGTTVLTTDTLVEGVHFRRPDISWLDLGWKSMAVNLSDIAAMGCMPTYSVITLGLSNDVPVDGLVEMYRGMLEACRQHGGTMVGGDVVRSPVFFVTVAMVGSLPTLEGGKTTKLLTRSSALPGDKIAVTGSLGCSGGGLRMFLDGLSFDDETAGHLKDAHNRPVPRVAQGRRLAARGVAAAIDISDGLVEDVGKLCKASGVGAVVRSDAVPIDEVLRRAYPDHWRSLALSGGEDYELAFTASPNIMDEVASDADVAVTVIGDIVAEPQEVRVLDQNGIPVPVERRGWDHFRRA